MTSKLKDTMRFLRYYVPALYRLARNGANCFLLVGTPLHGNIGDQAIVLGEEAYFKRSFPRCSLIEVPSRAFTGNESAWRWIARKCSAVLLHGGGYLGTLWPDEDRMVRSCFDVFSDLPIIVLPQTLYFEDGKADRNVDVYRSAIERCSDITICLRECASYELATACFGSDRTMLIPDMVLNLSANLLGVHKEESARCDAEKHVLLCLRRDKEKTIDATDEVTLRCAIMRALPGARITQTDTVIDGKVAPSRRREVVRSKVEEFQSADLVVTDRLHGMVLAAISGTPTIALKSKSPKVEGVYELSLSELENVCFCASIDHLPVSVGSVIGKRREYHPADTAKRYDALTRVIGAFIKRDGEANE